MVPKQLVLPVVALLVHHIRRPEIRARGTLYGDRALLNEEIGTRLGQTPNARAGLDTFLLTMHGVAGASTGAPQPGHLWSHSDDVIRVNLARKAPLQCNSVVLLMPDVASIERKLYSDVT